MMDAKRPGEGLRLIDVHHHCVLPEYEQALVRSGAADPSRPLRKNSDPAQAIEAMTGFGIAGAVVNPLSVAGVHHGDDANARYLCETTNEGLARFVQSAPGKLGFFAPLPFPDIDGSLRQLAYSLDTLNADGVILMTNQNGIYLGDPRGDALYAELDRRKCAVFVHPARPAFIDDLQLKLWAAIVEYPFETTRIAANLIYNEVMKKYPNIRWILAHAGGAVPYLSLRLRLMEEQDTQSPAFSMRVPEGTSPYVGQFYFDTAISGSRAAMAALTRITPPSHIMFGSDWPYIDRSYVDDQIADMRTMTELGGGVFQAVERESALALFPRFAG
ncbi:MAG: amidohydrolase 2 [Hyphomicrobiales bacterium]|nr:amidohydrolase 2 [Hyphomicrobiales bacterium]